MRPNKSVDWCDVHHYTNTVIFTVWCTEAQTTRYNFNVVRTKNVSHKAQDEVEWVTGVELTKMGHRLCIYLTIKQRALRSQVVYKQIVNKAQLVHYRS